MLLRGHDLIFDRFRRTLRAGRLASTFLFVGPPGIGKRSFALQFAQGLLCDRRPEEALDPCGQCPACAQVLAVTHPDVVVVAKPSDKNYIPLELLIGDKDHRMREGLCHDISLKPFSGRRKVAVIDDADFLNQEGANALLKSLEEPPPRSLLILIGTSEQRQLPTIRSRCQVVRFSPLAESDVAELLVSTGSCSDEPLARRAAALSGGSLAKAIQWCDEDFLAFRATLYEQLSQRDYDLPPLAKAVTSFVETAGKDAAHGKATLVDLLGIGGARAVKAYTALAGVPAPQVFHTNEGHAGFLGLERVSDLIGNGLSFSEALTAVRAGTVFTTHTPVPAGIDRFESSLIERYFSTDLLPGVDVEDVLALGAEDYEGGTPDTFNMAVMGLRLAQRANGVSQLHGDVSRGMFGALWPGFDRDDVPITSITNGVHAPTWTDPQVSALAESLLGTSDTTVANWRSDALSDGELWALRGRLREQLVADARRRTSAAWSEENPGVGDPAWFGRLLDPNVLTIGFARRVPTYKRLTLMLHDPERLRALLTHPTRPIQIVIAGKSHPADDEGKRLIQKLVEFSQGVDVRERIHFLPNYDIGMAQLLYPGTDIWLNNPLRPLEACGTSGMKAALNGSLNLSILDGWWNEYYDEEDGWAIPSADSAGDGAERDALEAASMYDLIEHQIAPRFYDRGDDGVPTRWVANIRHTLATLSPELSAGRMVREYVERLYLPAAAADRSISAKRYQPARDLAAWKSRVRAAWPSVHVTHVESGGVDASPQVGEQLQVRAVVQLGTLRPDDVSVELVHGRAREGDELVDTHSVELILDSMDATTPGLANYAGSVPLARSGSFGYTVRVVPQNRLLASPAELGLIAVA